MKSQNPLSQMIHERHEVSTRQNKLHPNCCWTNLDSMYSCEFSWISTWKVEPDGPGLLTDQTVSEGPWLSDLLSLAHIQLVFLSHPMRKVDSAKKNNLSHGQRDSVSFFSFFFFLLAKLYWL